ncbi:MAG: AAA family ATPase [Propionibacteriales bacterium]|nr:AAA family ATPase [Propionibacteriales bacterium]
MDLIGYLHIVRRRWALVVGAVVLALVVVWFALPAKSQAGPVVHSYTATATLVSNPSLETPPNLGSIALFVTAGRVPKLAAAKLDYEGEPQVLAASVSATVNSDTGAVTVRSTGSNGRATARKVNVFANQLLSYLRQHERQQAAEQIKVLDRQLEGLGNRLAELDSAVVSDPGDTVLAAERDALAVQYTEVSAQVSALQDELISPGPLEMLQPAVPIPDVTGGFNAPSSPRGRLAVGGALGLLLGLALALLVERVDSRLRTRDQAESAFQLPVLAEIPALPWQYRTGHAVLTATEPGSATAEAYRALRSAVLLLRASPAPDGSPGQPHAHDPTVILVTSPRGGEGKTTTVANLAVVMAESGRRVLVLSLDFRNPKIHSYLDVPDGAGLSDLLNAGHAHDLGLILRESPFAGVSVATSGQETGHPGALLAGVGPLVERARELADVVLIDTAPLLAVSDAVDLSPHVDAALVVSRANRTTAHQAAASQRLLSRLGVPALGAVLIGTGGPVRFENYVGHSSLFEQISARFSVLSKANRPVTQESTVSGHSGTADAREESDHG